MGFRKYKNSNSADLVHKIELYDLETGDPALLDGRRQFIVVKGGKSQAYKKSIDQENAKLKRKNMANSDLSFDDQINTLARRLSMLVVSAYVDVGDDNESDIIEFTDIDALPGETRDIERGRLISFFSEVTDIAILVNAEVVKDVNFLPGRAKTLSDMLSNENGTTQPQQEATTAA